ncbi:arginine tRS [Acrasis kona]|uniref:Arginine tRS n=1 Tax=Acrasis kona TaxID=1008807 RepID=A0AAW2Z6Z8_9EUKA
MSNTNVVTRFMVYQLYRSIMKKSADIKHTDIDYFRLRVRQEFDLVAKGREYTPETRLRMYQKGKDFLKDLGGVI